jgi:hypothetical protein
MDDGEKSASPECADTTLRTTFQPQVEANPTNAREDEIDTEESPSM